MKCAKCNKNWPAETKFCGACGAKMVTQPDRHPKEEEVIQQLRTLLPRVGLGEFKEPASGVFLAQKGSTHVEVRLVPLQPGVVAVRSSSPVTIGTPITKEVLEFLMKENATLVFGAFGLGSKNEILFSHSIMASSLDVQELGSSVSAVVNMADKLDDQIVQRWGGKTARQLALDKIVTPAMINALRAAPGRNRRGITPPVRRTQPHTKPQPSLTVSEAIRVGSIAEEYLYLSREKCTCGGKYKRDSQALFEEKGKFYDRLSLSCIDCGTTRNFIFDINSFFGKN